MTKKIPEKFIRIAINEGIMLFMSGLALVGIQSLNFFPVKDCLHFAILNILLFYIIYRLIYTISNRLWVSMALGGLLWYMLGVANHYTYKFRGSMMVPWDLLALKTAGDVSSTYKLSFYFGEVLWLLVIAAFTFISYKLVKPVERGIKRLPFTLVSLIITALLFVGLIKSPLYAEIPDRLYLVDRYYQNQGIAISFFNYSKFLYTEKPQGYTLEECKEIFSEYEKSEPAAKVTIPDNIICIMNESFADFRSIRSIPQVDECLDFVDSLSDNTIKGNLYVPVYGGTTVNSEYEFLTGNTTAYMKGCPFSYAVRDERPSVARYLGSLGYEVYGMHPATAFNWNRGTVYPYLGIDRLISWEELESENPQLINDHTTDQWDYDKLIDIYEHKSADKFFMFNVTMQNHGGYSFDYEAQTGEKPIDLSEYGDYPQAENYLSLLAKSDDALQSLIEYFKNVDEPTLILVFGDHQPNIEEGFLDALYGSSLSGATAEENIKKYVTPFIIWTNYDIEEKQYEMLSANYLAQLMLETAGIELPPFYQQLKHLREDYPVFTVNGAIDASGTYRELDEVELKPEVRDYRFTEYNSAGDTQDNIQWDAFQ